MSDQPEVRVDREGIHIERDLAESIAIEEELDANVVGPYRFPTPMRRRISAWIFLVGAGLSLVLIEGGWIVAVGFAALAAWHFLAAWPLGIDEYAALEIAGGSVEFPVGHASAAVTFSGWRSKPRWSVVLYSAVEPPDQRALVVVDAVSGQVAEEPYVEAIAGV